MLLTLKFKLQSARTHTNVYSRNVYIALIRYATTTSTKYSLPICNLPTAKYGFSHAGEKLLVVILCRLKSIYSAVSR